MKLPRTTAQDDTRSILSTTGLQRPAKRKSDGEHIPGSDVAVISRKHSDINLLGQKKITNILSAKACVLVETQTVGLPMHKPNALLQS
jgi:hypothetical protein